MGNTGPGVDGVVDKKRQKVLGYSDADLSSRFASSDGKSEQLMDEATVRKLMAAEKSRVLGQSEKEKEEKSKSVKKSKRKASSSRSRRKRRRSSSRESSSSPSRAKKKDPASMPVSLYIYIYMWV